jgi:acetyl esterase/lipase
VVFYVHGGGFHLLSKDTHWLMGLVFARHGYLVVNISYRLAPEHPYPAALEDTCAAYRWLAARIGALGGDPARVAVAGESAGGNLITALALTACQRRDEPWARAVFDTGLVPRAVLPFCAMLEVSRPERFSQRRRLPRWIDGMIRDASASYLHGHPPGPGPAIALADPLRILEEESRDAARGGVNGPASPVHSPEGVMGKPPYRSTRRWPGSPCSAAGTARCRRSSRRSAPAIRCSTTPAGWPARSTSSACHVRRATTPAGSTRSMPWSGIRPPAGAGATRSRSSIATCASRSPS